MLPRHLEEWLTDTGGDIVEKRHKDPASLSPMEHLIFEIWLLDTETRNGGLSQYFCNWGLPQWESCRAAAESAGLTSFSRFSEEVDSIIEDTDDPYLAIVDDDDEADFLWYAHQSEVVGELHAMCNGAGN